MVANEGRDSTLSVSGFVQTLKSKKVLFEGIENPRKSDFSDENPQKWVRFSLLPTQQHSTNPNRHNIQQNHQQNQQTQPQQTPDLSEEQEENSQATTNN